MKCTIILVAALFSVSIGLSQKKIHAKISEAQATKIVKEQFKDATIVTSELEKEEGKTIWSFDLNIEDAKMEVWVDANTGKVIKSEQESASQEQDEQVSDEAEKVALKKVPGEIQNTDVKLKKGQKIFSFEILTKKGLTVEVDVDAKSNKIVKIETEKKKADAEEDDDEDSDNEND